MSSHRSATPRRKRSGRTRALLSLAAVAVLATGMSVKGTFAFWTDAATVNAGSFTSGTLDITVNGQLAGQSNNGGTTTVAALNLANMAPGESMAASFPVANNGTIPLLYTLTGTGSGTLAVTNGLQYSVTFGASNTTGGAAFADNTGNAAAGTRAGTCGGTAATDGNTTLLTSTASTFATNRPLAVGATEYVCIVARLNSNAPNALQGQSGTASFLFASKQVGS